MLISSSLVLSILIGHTLVNTFGLLNVGLFLVTPSIAVYTIASTLVYEFSITFKQASRELKYDLDGHKINLKVKLEDCKEKLKDGKK
jgi:hypothetical protein